MDYFGIKYNAKKQNDNSATIDIDGEIGMSIDWEEWKIRTENTNKGFKKQLAQLGEVKEIVVNINSLGGDVIDGLSIHDQLKDHKAKIIVNVKGFTASAATIIAMAGDKINMSDNALFLIHKAWTWGAGNAIEMEKIVADLKTIDNVIMNIYAKRTGKGIDKIEELMNENNGNGIWINAKKAKELGYIDEVVEPSAKNSLSKVFLNSVMPPLPEEAEKLINNQIENNMKIKLSEFPIIGKLFAKQEVEEVEMTAENLTEIEAKTAEMQNSLNTANESIATLTTEKETAVNKVTEGEAENSALKTELETKNAEIITLTEKLKAGATNVEKIEDPNLVDEPIAKTKNELAAEANAKAIFENE